MVVTLAVWGGLGAEVPSPLPANLAAYGFLSVAGAEFAASRIPVPNLASPTNGEPVAVLKNAVLLVEWQHPRAVREVELEFADEPPPPEAVRVEWWHRVWPDNGQGGWMKLDDPFNGEWVAARGAVEVRDRVIRFRFAPLDSAELPGLKTPGAAFRLTYKLRLACARDVRLTRVEARSEAVLRRARLRFEWGVKTRVPGAWSPRFEVRNGALHSVTLEGTAAAVVEADYADAPDRLSADRGHVVFRSGRERSFSVFVDDVVRDGALFVRDLGVFVSNADHNLRFATWGGASGEVWKEGTVTEQVARRPEQTWAQACAAFPAKPPAYAFLGAPGLRQEIGLEPQGDIVLHADSLRSPGPDAAASPWRRWDALRLQFGIGEHPVMGPGDPRRVQRRLEGGWLPVIQHAWTDGDLAWAQCSVATPLMTNLAGLNSVTGTEPLVLATQFAVTNTGTVPRTAWLWLEFNHPLPLRVGADGSLVLTTPSDGMPRPGAVPVRGRFQTHGRGELDLGVLVPGETGSHNPAWRDSAAAREAVRYRVSLAPGDGHAFDFLLPYVELLDATEMAALRALSYPQVHAGAVAFWRERVAQGMTLETPEPWLDDFFRANLWRVLISTDLDPVTGQHQHGAATHQYRNFLNETMMVARSLDLRGEHTAARALIGTFLANQGVKGLPGNFRSAAGVLYAAHPEEPDPYTAQGYNLHHGWGLWAAAEHYRWTRDEGYLRSVASQLVHAADWITRERRATQFTLPGGARPVEWGLLPAGDLEDVEEYLYWYATAAYHHLGLQETAAVLELASRRSGASPEMAGTLRGEAARLGADAAAFREDIRASLAESVATSPVVRLRDGTWVPYVPPRAYGLTDRKEGWIREALYPALHLVAGGVLDDQHPCVDWMVQELEDNLFLSGESGYGVTNARAEFFDHGGFTLQPNLLDLALVHLRRDQVPNFLRSFYNTAAVSLYPDTLCFAEWVPEFGRGGGPLYKTPDECKFIQWLRQMLILERGDTLELGLGIPRAWMADGQRVKVERAVTWFGRLDLEITSHAVAGQARAVIRLQAAQPPRAIRLRLRHPDGRSIRAASANGKPAAVDGARQLIELPAGATTWEVTATFN